MTENPDSAAVQAMTTSLVYGFAFSQISGTVSRLGVPEVFDTPVKTLDELAAATGTHAPALLRLLRAASALGLLTQRSDGAFELTELGELLRKDEALGALLALYGNQSVWRAYGALEQATRTGQPGFELANGTGLFETLESGGETASHFNRAMNLVTAAQVPAIVGEYDFSPFRHIVDVGGGDGTLLAAILRSHESARGTLLDRPEALRSAQTTLTAAGVAGRCTVMEGDFMASVPEGGDAYVLKNILHNWEDARCVQILRNCAQASGPNGRILVPTLLLPETTDDTDRESAALMALSDVEMMVLTSGRERTRSEYESLFAAAGLTPGAAVPIRSLPGTYMLEATHGTAVRR
jgi:precorrin-6B methylase 2